MDSRSRGFCFTINNYTPDHIAKIEAIQCEYCVVGQEIAPETGTPHLQGYIYYSSAKKMKTMIKDLPGAHITIAKGTAIENQKYCSKEQVIYECGIPPSQGKRNDMAIVKEQMKTMTMRDIVLTATSVQSIRMAEIRLKYHERKRDWLPEVYWFWGPSGTGKTRTAFTMCTDPYVTMSNGKWWEGYDAHDDVIIDDLREKFMTYSDFLRLIDRYPYTIECKGGSRQFLAKRIFITCPYEPQNVWNTQEDSQQLLRRIQEIRYFGKDLKTDSLDIHGLSPIRPQVQEKGTRPEEEEYL